VARDRQRAKQRRRRQSGGANPPAGRRAPRTSGDPSLTDAHPDSGVEDVVDERGPEGTTPAPDPLKHSSPYVDEAKLAEAGAEPADPGFDEPGREEGPGDGVTQPELGEVVDAGEAGVIYEDELPEDEVDYDEAYEEDDRAPDAVEGDTLVAGGRGRGGRRRTSPAAEPHERHPERRRRGRLITFLGHCIDELKRVQWPNRRQTGQGTAVTLGFVVLAGGYLGLMDAIWKPIVEAII
jgi:preprotein translocase SecE subunit